MTANLFVTAIFCLFQISAALPAIKDESATQAKSEASPRPTIVLQAADAEQHGTLLATTRPGFTGSAYVTGIDDDDDHLTWHARVDQPGIYLLEIRYSSGALKGYELAVNGIAHDGMFEPTGDMFATHSAGKVALKAGDNVLELRRGWGHYDVDRIELIPTTLSNLKIPLATLCDPDATPAAHTLLQKLLDGYGKTTIAGVNSPDDAQIVIERAGVLPSLMVGDLIEFSPSRAERGALTKSLPERLIADAKSGFMLSVMWHWNAPSHLIDAVYEKDGKMVEGQWYFGFYTRATTFDLQAALHDPSGKDYQLLIRDIDVIAAQLKKLDDAGIPVLWRPLHEADGGWFWWGAKGPDAFKALWAILFDRLVHHHKLHNLVWVYTATTNWEWFPPADQFDIIGVDAYPKDPHDPLSSIWDALQTRWGDQKLIALTEYGGVPDLAEAARLGVRWAYYASWAGKLGPAMPTPAELKRLFHEPQMGVRSLPTTRATS